LWRHNRLALTRIAYIQYTTKISRTNGSNPELQAQ
jgi:hypothetical protein